MSFRCPGYLNAKSLLEGGDCREDYFEWFFSPKLHQYRALIDTVYRAMQYRGDDPVLLVCDVSDESCLLFRFTMQSQDCKGRTHQRCEVMKVAHSTLPMLLNCEFKIVPDEATKEFVVDGGEGMPLPHCKCYQMKNAKLDVYSRNPHACWFKNEETVQIMPPWQQPTDDSQRNNRFERTVTQPMNEKSIINKMLFALLALVCVFGGWNYFRSADEIERLRKDLENCRAVCSNLREENTKLQAETNKIDKWVRTRINFERNKNKLKSKFDEIIHNFREAESLITHIDEPLLSSSQERKGVGRFNSPDVTSGMNSVPDLAGKLHLSTSGDKEDGRATEPSGR